MLTTVKYRDVVVTDVSMRYILQVSAVADEPETESCCRCWICCCSVCRQLFQCSDIYDVGVKVCLDLPVFVSHHERDLLSLEILVLPFWYWLLNVCFTQEKR